MLPEHQRLGDFEILRLLGKGGMGEVYEARQFNPERLVALKVLAPWLASDEDALQRFWREAAVPAQLDHPGIVRTISTGKSADGIAYYTMHLVRGVSLAVMIRSAAAPEPATVPQPTAAEDTPSQANPLAGPPLAFATPPETSPPAILDDYRRDRFRTVARIGAQAARALAYAHRQGHLHRDIKPANLMVDHHNQVYLLDFGLTRALDADGNGTQPGMITGTPWYMSPEQAAGDALEPRSDLYSLGVTLYELAAQGLGPYTVGRQNKKEVLAQVRKGQCLPLRVVAPQVPPELERIISRAMQFKVSRRYADAAEFAADLEQFASTGNAALRHGPDTPRPAKQRRLIWAVCALAAAAALVGLGALFFAQPPVGEQPTLDESPTSQKGPPPLPTQLKNRTPRLPIELFKRDPVEPIWDWKVAGKGAYYRLPHQLELRAHADDVSTMLALDNDPHRGWFEFNIEVNQVPGRGPSDNQLGIFFGWRPPEETGRRGRFWVIRVDDLAEVAGGRGAVLVGTAYLDPGGGNAGSVSDWFRPLAANQGILPLRQTKIWHTLCVRAVGQRIEVIVDQTQRLTLDREQLRQTDPVAAAVDPRGALGIWARYGVGWFRRAAVTPLLP
ncbi:MAG TPA: serine/threonine-protein kinase [Gemmataceae bacterium]|nr:serine/threonine-protein kinase [Gemmataceae bacterium]